MEQNSNKKSTDINMIGVGCAALMATGAGLLFSALPLVGAGVLAYKAATTSLEIADAIKKYKSPKNLSGSDLAKDTILKCGIAPVFGPARKKSYRLFNEKRSAKTWAAAAALFAVAAVSMWTVPYVGVAALTGFVAKRSIELAKKVSQDGLVNSIFRPKSDTNTDSNTKSNEKSLVRQAMKAQDTLRNKEAYIQARSAKERKEREDAVAKANAAGKPLSAEEVTKLRNKEGKKRAEALKRYFRKNGGR